MQENKPKVYIEKFEKELEEQNKKLEEIEKNKTTFTCE